MKTEDGINLSTDVEIPPPVTTDTFAAKNLVKPQTVRARLCRYGSYFGVRPCKLKNGRLGWPDVQVEVA